MIKLLKSILLLSFLINISFASEIEIDNSLRASKLYRQIRCLTCSGQTIEGSNSQFAEKVKAEIKVMLDKQYSEEQIKKILLLQYGNDILMNSEMNKNTLIIWLLPIIILIFGSYYLIIFYRKNVIRM